MQPDDQDRHSAQAQVSFQRERTTQILCPKVWNWGQRVRLERQVLTLINPGMTSILSHPTDKHLIMGESPTSIKLHELAKKLGMPVATSTKEAVWQFADQRNIGRFKADYKHHIYDVLKNWTIASTIKDEPETDELIPDYQASALIVLLCVAAVTAAINCFTPMPLDNDPMEE
jgi:hypothetical protein